MEAETGFCYHQARNTQGHEKLEEARKDPPLKPSERAWLCRHLDYGLRASLNRENHFLLFHATQFVIILLQQPYEANI